MGWSAPVDLYCERIGSDLLAEPLNAISNIAFFLAAFIAARHALASSRARGDLFLWLLITLVIVIGAGSTIFHVAATRWSVLADVVPITLFIVAFFLYAMRRFLGLNWLAALMVTAAFYFASWVFGQSLPPEFMNGSGNYLPVFIALLGVGSLLMVRNHPAGPWLAGAAGIFLFSLTFRTIDNAICSLLPIGVHYFWHVLNGIMLFLLLEAGVRFGRREAPRV